MPRARGPRLLSTTDRVMWKSTASSFSVARNPGRRERSHESRSRHRVLALQPAEVEFPPMTDNASGARRETPLAHYWNVLRKRKTTVLGFTGALMTTVLAASLVSTRYYESSATLEIAPKAPVILDVERVTDIVPQTYGQIQQYYATQYKVI